MATAAPAPPAAPTAAGTILAIDLGRYKSVACLYDRATHATAFQTHDTGRADFDRLFQRHPGTLVVVEACSNAGWAADLAAAHGLAVKVANTSGEVWRFTHPKRKTDKDDAQRLAEPEALGQLPTVILPDAAASQRRALIAHRQALVGRRVAAQNRARALFAGQGLPSPRGHRAWTATGLGGLDAQARPPADCAPAELWRGVLHLAPADYRHLLAQRTDCEAALDRLAAADPATRRLATIPGVGPRTAEAVAAHLGDPRRFASGKRVSAYAGLVPRQYQSGEADRRGRITRRGPGVLRKLLVECAWAMPRNNPWARATYARLTRGGVTRRKPAVVALARRLLVRCWAMPRDGADWRADPAPAPTP
jgi:transposase